MQVINLKLESNMKEQMLEAIYGTVERLEQKVDELSASPKNTEAESTPVSVSVDTSKLEKAILAMAVKEGEAIDKVNICRLKISSIWCCTARLADAIRTIVWNS